MKRSFIAVLAVVLTLAMVGCGGPKVSPEETVKIYLNMAIKSDLSEASKIGISDEEQKKVKELKEKNLNLAAKMMFSNAETKANDEAKDKFKNALTQLAQKITFTTEAVSKDDKSAVVKVSVISPNQDEFLSEQLVPKIQEKAGDSNFNWASEGANLIADLYAGAVDTLPMKAEPTVFEVKCVIDPKTKCWKPENANAFRENIVAATDGM